ncbi:MAG: hypothetical protein V6Z86_05630 [Hyphomicrobiales bacterium]
MKMTPEQFDALLDLIELMIEDQEVQQKDSGHYYTAQMQIAHERQEAAATCRRLLVDKED